MAYKKGARKFLAKPIKEDDLKKLFQDITEFNNKAVKNLLIVDDNAQELETMVKAVEFSDVKITTAGSAKEAKNLVRENDYDCIILDLILPDESGLEIVKELERERPERFSALIIYSAKDLTDKEKSKLNQFANRVILKTAGSINMLVDQVALFLHREHKLLPQEMRNTIETYCMSNDVLKGKKVLIVDDDMRNLFALTTALERFDLNIITAESGKEAINILQKEGDIDIVLMDIMMPEMDGYETMKRIRDDKKNRDMTIIAVTAKAMKGDRQKCIESGASDYITKPVNVEHLVSLMRVWLK
jgi:CheY-like chemotaxis protein